jgi:dihydrofolate reductase
MPLVTAHLSISLDGFVAGPEQSEQNPIGVGGTALHRWHLDEPKSDADQRMTDRVLAPRGAFVMGRNMFGPVRGDWGDSDWRGWWGDEPSYHAPVFVLTHYPREPIPMAGGTTFFFVDDFDSAIEQAVAAAGDRTVTIAGGASAVRQGLQRGVVDEILLSHIPVVLGSGERLFDGISHLRAEPVEVAASPVATHVVYRMTRA